jgi:hypothetical protein
MDHGSGLEAGSGNPREFEPALSLQRLEVFEKSFSTIALHKIVEEEFLFRPA